MTESTFTPAPEPAEAFVSEPFTPEAEPSAPQGTDKLASIAAEHPEYLIAAALVAGFLLAKVVRKLAA